MAVPADLPFSADLYDRLGLAPAAPTSAIRRRFRQLARLYHPDHSHDPATAERFLALQAAHEILGDPAARRRYDGWLEAQGARVRPVSLRVTLGPLHLQASAGRQRLYVLAGCAATHDPAADDSRLNLVLVLDRSSSMRGERLRYARQAAAAIAGKLGAEDLLGIVTFGDRAQVALPVGPGAPPHVIRGILESIEAGGGTEIASGLELALRQARAHRAPDRLSHLIVLTDGYTYGDEARALQLSEQAAAEQIGLTALGIGNDWNDTFLDDLAGRARGRTYYIARPEDVLAAFERTFGQLRQTLVRDSAVRLEPAAPSVEIRGFYEVAPELRHLTVRPEGVALGPITTRSPVQVLIELVVEPGDRDLLLLGDLRLRATLLRGQGETVVEQPLVSAVAPGAGETPAEIVAAAQRVAALRLQERAWQTAASGDLRGAQQDVALLVTRVLELGEVELAEAIRHRLEVFAATGQLPPDAGKLLKYGTRRLALPPPENER